MNESLPKDLIFSAASAFCSSVSIPQSSADHQNDDVTSCDARENGKLHTGEISVDVSVVEQGLGIDLSTIRDDDGQFWLIGRLSGQVLYLSNDVVATEYGTCDRLSSMVTAHRCRHRTRRAFRSGEV